MSTGPRRARTGCGLLLCVVVALLPAAGLAQDQSQLPASHYYVHRGQRIPVEQSSSELSVRYRTGRAAGGAPQRLHTSVGPFLMSDTAVHPSASLVSVGKEGVVEGIESLGGVPEPDAPAEAKASAAAARAQEHVTALMEVRAQLTTSPDVVWAYPVFVHPGSGQRLLLTNEIVLKARPGLDTATVQRLLPAGLRVVRTLLQTEDEFVIEVSNPRISDPLALANLLAETQAWVEWAHPNFVREYVLGAVPNDPLFASQWHLRNTGQGAGVPGADAEVEPVWDLQTGSASIVIAIIDDGVTLTHPDLAENLFVNEGEIPGNGVDDDGNGKIDDVNGWDFSKNDNDPSPISGVSSHGTAVAGVAAARGSNGIGVTGACQRCRILPVKIFHGSSFAGDAATAEAIRYAARLADVLNNSWGGGAPSAALQSAIQFAVTQGRGGKGAPALFASGNSASGYLSATLSGISAGTWTFEWEYFKDGSVSSGFDTAWLDDVTFPGGATENFEACSGLPSGWSTTGSASWAIVDDATRASSRRGGQCAAKAGAVSNSQSTTVRVTRTVPAGTLSYRVWPSAEPRSGGGVLTSSCFDGIRLFATGPNGVRQGPFHTLCGTFSNQDTPLQDGRVSFPAAFPEAIAVGASTNFDRRSEYSQWGPELFLVAPSSGGSLGITTTDGPGASEYRTDFGGTSSATPLASGVVGLMLSANPALTETQVRERLGNAARKIGELTYGAGDRNDRYGHGRISASAVVSDPTVTLAPAACATLETGAACVFTVARTGPTTAPLTVTYAVGGAATLGSDYTLSPAPPSVTIPAGAASATITVTPIADDLVEGEEAVVLQLQASAAYVLGDASSAVATISDKPVVTVAASDAGAAEAGLDAGSVTISRTGPTDAPLTVSYAMGGSATNGVDYQTLSGSATLAAGQASTAISVTPIDDALVEGSETAIVQLQANAAYTVGASSSATVTIADNDVAVGPDVSATPSALDFGAVPVGTKSAPRTLTLRNDGAAALVIGSIKLGGVNRDQFIKPSDRCSGKTLAAASTCDVEVAFKPTKSGAQSATLVIPSNDPDENPLNVALTGTGGGGTGGGGGAEITVSPASLAFGDVRVNSKSALQTVSVRNDGTAPLILGAIKLGGTNPDQFAKPSDACSKRTLAPGDACAVTIVFKPTKTGAKTATLVIPSNDADENPVTVGLAGTGTP